MMKPKTRLIWTVTHFGCEKLGLEAITETLTKYNIHAVRAAYSSLLKENLVELRKKLTQKIKSEKNQPSDGKVPFLLSFVGRKALLSVPNTEMEVADNASIEISVCVDFNFCASFGRQNSQQDKIEIFVSSDDQINTLKVGSLLNISFGNIELKITDINKKSDTLRELKCVVLHGGTLRSGMEVHSADMLRDLFPLLPEDKKTLQDNFGNLADFVIVDGIKTAEELFFIKKSILGEKSQQSERHPSVSITENVLEAEALIPPRFLLKVDSKRVLDFLPSVLKHIDGVFLSRSEVGLDEHPHNLPILQKDLIAQCNKMSKIIIVASELMFSMRVNANPTRAEVSDMANAAADGADALVLSHEVTEGPNADLVAEVSYETLVNSQVWLEKKWRPFEMDDIPTDDDAVTYGAIHIAQQANVRAIVCFTEGGYTAVKLSSMRTPTEIIAITCNKKMMRQMNLLRSVTSVILESKLEVEKILSEAKEILVTGFDFKDGEPFVFVSLTASSVAARNSNLFTLQEI